MKGRCPVLLVAVCGCVAAGDWEFDHIVKAIEARYDTKRTYIPLMGMANLFVKVARPAGTSSFKLAVFEDLKWHDEDRETLDRFLDTTVMGRLHRIVRVHSRRDGESTYIFADDAGKSTRLLIVTFERHEATVIQAKVNLKALMKVLDQPERAGKWLSGTPGH